jgi:dTDP-glucose 4,6-dehydratase
MNAAVRNVLVTGGAGFIGANFVQYWLTNRPGGRLIVLDALTYAGNLASLRSVESRSEFRFVRGSIGDTALVEDLLRTEHIDTIVNFAAESHVDRSIHGPDAFIDTNVVGTHGLLKGARKVWLEERSVQGYRFHHVSTDEVYGSLGPHDPAFTESTPFAPNSPYSASKAASDHLVRAYHHTFGLPVTTTNCSNNYGPLHFPEKLIPLVIVNILEGRELPLYGDGGNVRDWLFVADHCRAIEAVLDRGVAGEVYNVGGLSECRNIDLVKRLCALADAKFVADPSLRERFPHCPAARGECSDGLIRFVRDRPGHDRRYAIDCTKIARELGFSPSVSLDAGLASTFEWYLQNEPWWRQVLDGSYRQWISRQYATGA